MLFIKVRYYISILVIANILLLNLKDSITISHALLHYFPTTLHTHPSHSHNHSISDHIDLSDSDEEAIKQYKPLKKVKHTLVKNNKVDLFIVNFRFTDHRLGLIFCKKNDFNIKVRRFVSLIAEPNLLPPELA